MANGYLLCDCLIIRQYPDEVNAILMQLEIQLGLPLYNLCLQYLPECIGDLYLLGGGREGDGGRVYFKMSKIIKIAPKAPKMPYAVPDEIGFCGLSV